MIHALLGNCSLVANEEFFKKQPDYDSAIRAAKRRSDALAAKMEKVTYAVLNAATDTERRMWLEKTQSVHTQKEEMDRQIKDLTVRKNEKRCFRWSYGKNQL